MIIQTAEGFDCGRWQGKSVEIEAIEENMSSDGGLLLFGQLDKKLGWTEGFAELISDSRDSCVHSVLSMVRQRVFGVLAGYEDQNDHDTLRFDPIFKLIAERVPDEKDLASQPTLSRLENMVTANDLLQMEEWFIDRFVDSFDETPPCITLDIDTFDDPAHGGQQLTFFHGFYDQVQYLLRAVTCAENDLVVLPTLLFGNASAKLGAADALKRVIERLQQSFPDTLIHLRADSAFGGPDVYTTLDSFPKVIYSICMRTNSKIKGMSEKHLEKATKDHQETGEPQVLYHTLENYKSKRWLSSKTLVIKTEVTDHSTSQRVVVTNRSVAVEEPGRVYREYAQRGESENRNKELKCDLSIDRLSNHRYMANVFRMMMHSLAHNLVVAMRRLVADQHSSEPEMDTEDQDDNTEAHDDPTLDSESTKRKRHNARRQRDPLGQAHPCTWRMLVIKVAARVVVSTRRVRLLLSNSWPNLANLRRTALALNT